jgi:hypothetical protein
MLAADSAQGEPGSREGSLYALVRGPSLDNNTDG